MINVSVIFGTVNRLPSLQACVAAIRASLADSGLTYEIVIAYGTNEDASLPWMREQADIVPVWSGLDGAIPAFNRAYYRSRGEYICQINDDVTVDGPSIANAVRHMQADPTCAGVVFKCERGNGYGCCWTYMGDAVTRKHTTHGILHPNEMVVRRTTCEAVIEHLGAFWGGEAQRTDKTYGGDSAFGAYCYHLGLRLDGFDDVTCHDHAFVDDLRYRNAQLAPDHWPRWTGTYKPMMESAPRAAPGPNEWPNLYVPRLGMAPRRSPVEAGRPLRLLLLHLGSHEEPLHDMTRAFSRVGETLAMPWWPLDAAAVARAAAEIRPDVVFAQIQHHGWPESLTATLRGIAGPACTFVQWSGDVRTSGGQPVDRWLYGVGHDFDLVLADNCAYPRKLKLDNKVPATCGYLACGIDPTLNPYRRDEPESSEVVFLGTNYKHLDGGARERLMRTVAAKVPGLTVYGPLWEGQPFTVHPFVEQGSASCIMRRALLTISTSLFRDLPRYTSDRLKRAAASGAVIAVERFPDMEGLGFRPGTDCLTWETTDELIALCNDWRRLERAEERTSLRHRVATMAHERFTWDRVVEEFLAIVRDYRSRRNLP